MTPPETHSRTISVDLPAGLKILIAIVLLFMTAPGIMYLIWLTQSPHMLSLLIVDKSSQDARGLERASFYWILRHLKVVRTDGRSYEPETDFLGFVPVLDSSFALTGLESLDSAQVDSLAQRTDAAYFVDTYGVTEAERDRPETVSGFSRGIYGGLSSSDLRFIRLLREKKKPVIAEFNFFGSPTPPAIRHQAEEMLGITWTGWVGRYYSSLDSTNDELPSWMIERCLSQYGSWNYHRPGVVLAHEDGRVLVLEEGGLLEHAVPLIVSRPESASQYGVSEEVPYPFWFDIVLPSEAHSVPSVLTLQTTPVGDSILARHHLRNVFPAVIRSKASPDFTYLCLDAADNPRPVWLFASLEGIELFKSFFYSGSDPADRRRFYWQFYFPLMSHMVSEIHRSSAP